MKYALLILLLCTGCAQTLWIEKNYPNNTGKIRYLDDEDRDLALTQAAQFCAPGKAQLIRDGHYQTLLTSQPMKTRETNYSFIEFACVKGEV